MNKKDLSFYETTKYKSTLCFSIALFFYLFLVFFLPFGIDNYNPDHQYTLDFFLEISKFAAGIFIVAVLNEFLVRPLFVRTTTLKKIMAWSIWTLLLLSTVTFFMYNYLGNWHDYLLKSYLGFLVNTSSVLIFPVLGVFFVFKYRSLRLEFEHIVTTKEEFIDAGQLIHFKGQGAKDQITLTVSGFLYGKAQDNYVELYYLEQQQLKKFLIRSSLQNLADSIHSKAIKRCHRSYIANLLHVKTVKGAHHEMTLFLGDFDTAVPVSKSYGDAVLKALRELKNFG